MDMENFTLNTHHAYLNNDLGDGIEGVATKKSSVASDAFSQDERRLLVVGNDGVVVVRNLKFAGKTN